MRKRPTREDWQRVHDIGDEPPPSATTKWVSWGSALLLLAIVGALVGGFLPYVWMTDRDYETRRLADDLVASEASTSFGIRALVGAICGLVFATSCLAASQRRKRRD